MSRGHWPPRYFETAQKQVGHFCLQIKINCQVHHQSVIDTESLNRGDTSELELLGSHLQNI